ncbi:MAG TPA: flagellar hook-associated protein FlgK [Candidatus Aminicenantes bacterium]|nr:flagellar hook-associated protein FlgK [Candidatus Aminicenantes bacterium]
MMNLFSAMLLGKDSLMTYQQLFQMVGHNIANVNTEGYSRQIAELQSVPPEALGYSSSGRGVDLQSIFAVRSQFINAQVVDKQQLQSRNDTLAEALSAVEALFSEANDNGLSDSLGEFFSKWSDVANQPTDLATREEMIRNAQNLAARVSGSYQDLTVQQGLQNDKIGVLVDEINTIGHSIAALNVQITTAENCGQEANDLLDERARLIRQVSEKIGVNVNYEQSSGAATLTISNRPFVVGSEVNELSAIRDTTNSSYYDVHIATSSLSSVDITGEIANGEVGGLLAARDTVIPELKQQLDNLAYGLITHVNAIHQTGFALDGTTTGQDFFVDFTPTAVGDYTGAAASLEVNPALVADATLLAVSATGAAGNNETALALAALVNETDVVDADNDGTADFGSFHDYLHSTYAWLGNQTSAAKNEADSYDTLLTNLDNNRDSISGVSLDEEASCLMQYQKTYNAIAQFISVVDGLTDTLLSIGT